MTTEHKELLIEIGCEEMPASWLPGITRQLASALSSRLEEARIISRAPVVPFSTPRRLGVSVMELAGRQTDLQETVTGPPVSAAFDSDGQPKPAALGFASKQGVTVDRLVRLTTPKGEYLACKRSQRGRTTRSVLGGVFAATLRDLAFPKQMQWDARLEDGRGRFVFGRPIRWLLFLYDGRVVPFSIQRTATAMSTGVKTVRSGGVTYGHRFFSRQGTAGQKLKVKSFADYRKQLAGAYVLIEHDERRDRVAKKLESCARKVGGSVAKMSTGSSLLAEVPDLIEYPSVVTGEFPEEFLSLPDEVLSTTMIHHQHYFPIVDRNGDLKPNFLAVTNTPRDNVARIAKNCERVLVARLRDARFFWDADRSCKLDDRFDRLDTLLFHKKLGSYKKKSMRVAQLAERIAKDVLFVSDAATSAYRAGKLSKCDLASDMVGEFPELQGVMGGVYAREQGEDERVCTAIYHHYLPAGVHEDAPPSRQALGEAAIVWAAVSLADKADTVAGLFGAGEKPTGSRDPLGMRRQAQGMLRILVDLPQLTGLDVRVSIGDVCRLAHEVQDKDFKVNERESLFLLERLRYLLEARGFDVRNVRAVTHESVDRIRPLDARRKLEVLPEFSGTSDFQKLATLFKRVKNIARGLSDAEFLELETNDVPIADILMESSERALIEELTLCRHVIEGAVNSGTGYREAFASAATLGSAVDLFFAEVFVMTDDVSLRRARLRLMKQVERLILKLGDVSELVRET